MGSEALEQVALRSGRCPVLEIFKVRLHWALNSLMELWICLHSQESCTRSSLKVPYNSNDSVIYFGFASVNSISDTYTAVNCVLAFNCYG